MPALLYAVMTADFFSQSLHDTVYCHFTVVHFACRLRLQML